MHLGVRMVHAVGQKSRGVNALLFQPLPFRVDVGHRHALLSCHLSCGFRVLIHFTASLHIYIEYMHKAPKAGKSLDRSGTEHARGHHDDLDSLCLELSEDCAHVKLVFFQRRGALTGVGHVVGTEHDTAEVRLFVQHVGLDTLQPVGSEVPSYPCVDDRDLFAVFLPDAVCQQLVVHQLRFPGGSLVAVGELKLAMGHTVTEKA